MQKQQKQGLNVVSKVQMSILKNSEKKKKKKKSSINSGHETDEYNKPVTIIRYWCNMKQHILCMQASNWKK